MNHFVYFHTKICNWRLCSLFEGGNGGRWLVYNFGPMHGTKRTNPEYELADPVFSSNTV